MHVCVGVLEASQSAGETENRCLSQTLTQELLMVVTTVTTGLNVAYNITFCLCVSVKERDAVCKNDVACGDW